MKHIFLINPTSGRSRKYDIESAIEKVCKDNIVDYEIYVGKKPGDLERYAKTFENEETAVFYAVGGDGTVNEVLNGIAGSLHMLSVLPVGSGNDFYRTLEEYTAERFDCDVGRVNNRLFINIACIGLDGEIADNLSLIRKHSAIPIRMRYTASIVYTFFKYKYKKLKITFGDKSFTSFYTIAAFCNARYYGGGYKIAPNAGINDGELDIYMVRKMPKRKIAGMFKKVKKGKHQKESIFKIYRDSAFVIDSEQDVVCNFDGESIRAKHFEIDVVPSAVTIYKNTELVSQILELYEDKGKK